MHDPMAYADTQDLDAGMGFDDLVKACYPYKWAPLAGTSGDELLKNLTALDQIRELAITVEGSNVLGFLDSEQGLHRINEQRPSGEQSKVLVELQVIRAWGGNGHLDTELGWRGYENEQFRALLPPDVVENRKQLEPDIARIYQFAAPRHVTDPRTKIRHGDVDAVLDGDLDDFILAYLRMKQAQNETTL